MKHTAPVLVAALALAACGEAPGPALEMSPSSGGQATFIESQRGDATWYSDRLAGHHTASGVPYEPDRMTAAHRSLPFGSRVRVTREDSGRSVDVVVNDRGPFGDTRRIIDISRAAATALGMLSAGVVPVRLDVLERGHQHYRRAAR